MLTLPTTQEIAREDMMAAFARFIDRETKNGQARQPTVAAYFQAAKNYVAWCQSQGIDPATATVDNVIDYRQHLYGKYKPKTVQLYMTGVRQLYRACRRVWPQMENPAADVRAAGDGTSEVEHMKALSEDALRALLESVPRNTLAGQRDRAVVGLMALHGLRRAEVAKISHRDIETGDPWRLRVDGKGGKIRTVFLRADTTALIRAYVVAKAASYDTAPESPLFMSLSNNNAGGRLQLGTLNRIVDKYLGSTSLKRAGVSCHALRHTFGTLAVKGGAKVEHLRDAMGHSKLETTGLYVHAVERERMNPANSIMVDI